MTAGASDSALMLTMCALQMLVLLLLLLLKVKGSQFVQRLHPHEVSLRRSGIARIRLSLRQKAATYAVCTIQKNYKYT